MGFLRVVGWVSDWITTGPIVWIFHLNVVNWKQQLTTTWIIKSTTLPSILSSPTVDSNYMLSHWEEKKKKKEQNQRRNKEPSRNHYMGTGDDYSHHPWSQKHFAWRWWLCMWRCCRTALMKRGCAPGLPFIQYPTFTLVSVQSHLR